MKTLVTMGRGGTGKTSFTALMAKYFIGSGQSPLLLVDLDPDQNLAEMVGVDLEREGVKTIADLLAATFIEQGGTTAGIAPSERIENTIWEEGLYEGAHFDLIAVGTKWIEGCYC
ncbi:MAG: cobalamin biosynthesis protein, partial [Methanomicrobiales archaeon]|nr:cobalamin biosynthesis protein [Methanomicrobiales archaeon]